MERRRYEDAGGRPRRRKKKKKKPQFLYAFIVFVLGLAIVGLGIMLLFRVQTVKIEGNDYCTDRQVKEMVQNDKYSVNSLYIIGKYMVGRGEVLPCLESVKVSLKSPWEVKVVVREKTIIGYMSDGEEYAYFDKEGLVVFKSNGLMEEVPFVEGIEVKGTRLYQKLESSEAGIFEEILETSRELKKYSLTAEKILCRNGNIYLKLEKVYVNLGKSVSADKVAQIPPILEKLGRKKGMVHLENYSEDQGTVTFNKGETLKEK